MVNVINVIFGGSNKPVHEKMRQRKDYLRSVNHVCEGKHFRTPWSHVPITFTQADLKLKHYPHNDPLVIKANTGKNTVHFFGNDIGRILVDNDSLADIILWRCFAQMGFTEKDLKRST
ncbi:prpol [Panicum miliaceum]|uniref:Prpol n=1 Tax=Panicum miliaceum TaxID=4540 RepID=A0A3L6S1Z6_PANMI|nr:prpol [Panicum miliaceum]